MNIYLERLENGENARCLILEMFQKMEKDNSNLIESYDCTDFSISLSDMKQRIQKVTQEPTGEIYTIKVYSR